MGDWDVLWGHMKCRVAHSLRLIAFDVGDTPRHRIERFAPLEGRYVTFWGFL